MLVEKNPAFPFIVISPQLPEQSATVGQLWPIPPLEAILDHALKTLRIDPSRVYLTGLSLGGMATWDWGTAQPGPFRGAGAGCRVRRPVEGLQCEGCARVGLPWRP